MKILVAYATAGAGHKKAAEALYKGLCAMDEHEAFFMDALEYTTGVYRYSYSSTYTFLVSYLPWLWGAFFWLLDRPWMFSVMTLVRRVHNTIHAQKLVRFLQQEQFDYIFSTHFLPNEVSTHLKRKGKIKSRIICCVTDFDVHRIWLSLGIDQYCVASDWTKNKLASLGIEEQKIFITGIPTDLKFSQHEDIAALKEKLDLEEGIFTVLIATGSFGIGPIEEIVDQLDGIQVLAICGHNKKLYERLTQKNKVYLKVYGFVNNMDELMAVSDAMITKPGGLSISEALVTGLPLIFFNAIPGQEDNNVKVLATYQVGISGKSVNEMAGVLQEFRQSMEAYRDASYHADHLGKPNAVHDILSLVKSDE